MLYIYIYTQTHRHTHTHTHIHMCTHICNVYICKKRESVSQCCAQLFVSHGMQPTRLLCPWNSPGKNTGVGFHSLLQGLSTTQGLNPGFLHFRQIFYCLSHQGSPFYMYMLQTYMCMCIIHTYTYTHMHTCMCDVHIHMHIYVYHLYSVQCSIS